MSRLAPPTCTLRLSSELVGLLTPDAASRGMAPPRLAGLILRAVAADGMVGAVLDDDVATRSASIDARIGYLRRALNEAEGRVAELEDILLARDVALPQAWGLKRREAQILRLLLARDCLSKEAIWTALYSVDGDVPSDVVESHISKMRKKIAPFGLVVEGKRFVGYSLVDRLKWRRELGAAS